MKPQQPVLPFKQGDLDGLCGIYATINAVRLVLAAKGMRLPRTAWQEMFAELLCTADDAIGAVNAATAGMEARPLRKILKSAVQHMRDEHEIELRAAPVLARGVRPPLGELVCRLRETVGDENSVVIASFAGHLNHWTVITRAGPRWLELFDSGRLRRISIEHCRMSYEPRPRSGTDHFVHANALFAVRAKSTC